MQTAGTWRAETVTRCGLKFQVAVFAVEPITIAEESSMTDKKPSLEGKAIEGLRNTQASMAIDGLIISDEMLFRIGEERVRTGDAEKIREIARRARNEPDRPFKELVDEILGPPNPLRKVPGQR